EAPRVLIANSNLVGYWSNYEQFNKLERLGLTMYGQMTAGSWIYIGSQGIVQGTFETFGAAGEKHFDGNLAGKLIVSGGLGGMGGAQPLAATMNGACFIGVEVDPARIEKRLATGYCDHMVQSLDQALQLVDEARKAKRATSVGLVGNCADVLPEMVKRNFVPDYIRPLFCEGKGPFRWVALSGDPEDIARTDTLALELFPENAILARWMKLAKERIHFQGLPARICWLGYGERAEFGVAMN